MIPEDLKARKLRLPRSDSYPIVVISGNELRHERFALRIQKEFGEAVLAWIQVETSSTNNRRKAQSKSRDLSRILSVARNHDKLTHVVPMLERQVSSFHYEWSKSLAQREVEKLLFGNEITRLKRSAHLKPKPVKDPNSNEIVEWLQSLQPYFILTLGGAIYGKPLRDCATGLAINQHDGWCPEYKGSLTVNWALYHRDISHLGSTVHILSGDLDAGSILRRSTPCLLPADTPASCFARCVALGTELMCEVVQEIHQTNEIMAYDQPLGSGYTYISSHFDEHIKQSIDRDFEAKWLVRELARLRRF